jgi:copper chaperone CopZ
LNIIVCIKQAPGITDVRINPETGTSKKVYLYRRTGQLVMIGISYYFPYN